ncbi:ankyrin repeat-containing domain protein [Baffinella frigidus]|nr:ankyrin repeat-containing domain protein [Cryptophyta sp. CCMP2293]
MDEEQEEEEEEEVEEEEEEEDEEEAPASPRGTLRPALWTAAVQGTTEDLRRLLAEGPGDIEERGGVTECTPLIAAAHRGIRPVLLLLLEAGAEISATDKRARSPLHAAAHQGHEAAVLLLLEAGADVSAKDGDGDTPLGCAAECTAVVGPRLPADALEVGGGRGGCHAAVAVLLIENGAELSAKNNHGRTPLHIAAYFGNEVLAKVLLEHGADVSARNEP